MKAIYGNICISEDNVCKWVQKHKDSVHELDDASQLGWVYHIVAPNSTVEADCQTGKNQKVILDYLTKLLQFFVGLAHNLVH